jgi:hypothetical protein
MRSLANVIVTQKSEAEHFIIDAIAEIKQKMKKEADKKNKFKPMRPETASKLATLSENEFQTLSWEEKEMALRQLFAKLNGKKNLLGAEFSNFFLNENN